MIFSSCWRPLRDLQSFSAQSLSLLSVRSLCICKLCDPCLISRLSLILSRESIARSMEYKEECSAVSASKCTEFSQGFKKLPYPFVGKNGADDDLIDKKRRLTLEQINYLEMSFRMDLKLEPERKALIAKELGIRPRQVAIWFQNRRVRWKNKKLEQDCEMLKVKHDAAIIEKENLLKEYESTLQDNKRLQAEVDGLMNLIQCSNVLDMNSALSSSKKEQISNNVELMSPTKSVDCQSEIDDIFMPPEEHKAVMTNLNGTVECAWMADGDCPLFMSSDNVFGSFPILVQQLIANGHCFEDAYNIYLGCEYFGGWR